MEERTTMSEIFMTIRKNGSVVNLEVGEAYLPAVQEILKNL